ncbi:YdcH family protein [Undibacterium sp. RuTC16W]|uniref:YdcH family protein n=1 Tax=Undibacterium sp. RuTC16W TaxID=3413048 RepID=UPI003BF2A9C3
MRIEHHPLSAEFPEFKDTIHAFKLSNAHFSKLFDEYAETDKAVNRAENGIDHLNDAALEELKKVRVVLKDHLFQLLQTARDA